MSRSVYCKVFRDRKWGGDREDIAGAGFDRHHMLWVINREEVSAGMHFVETSLTKL